jgi:hypothetical protein
LKNLGDLSEKLFQLREGLAIPSAELRKRKRDDVEDVTREDYWIYAGRESLRMTDE